MTREIYVVAVLRDSAWIDVAEFDEDEDSAFLKADELRATELDVRITRRWSWLGKDYIDPVKD